VPEALSSNASPTTKEKNKNSGRIEHILTVSLQKKELKTSSDIVATTGNICRASYFYFICFNLKKVTTVSFMP
jgi:hypothetical protein